jgi:hypothetical protein
VLPKLIGRAQKGFMKNQNIHMCNINIIDSISQSWINNEATGILCVDFSKAFDSIEHYVIGQVLKFFNFGDFMVRTVETLLRNRIGTVILTNGFSDKFEIKRGTPQGDRTSPYIFILYIEILLLKLKCVEKDNRGMTCTFHRNLQEGGGVEGGLAEAYADDLTIIFKWEEGTLGEILNILRSFGELTGLIINVDKTQLMVVGIQ